MLVVTISATIPLMTAKYITTFDENNVYNSYEFYYNIRMSGKTNIQIQLNL